jgi:Ca-activated chloride channel family protein
MSFSHPWILAGLALPVALVMWEIQRPGHRVPLPFDHGRSTDARALRRVLTLFHLVPHLLLAVGILLLAGPRTLAVPELQRALNNIQFCLDVSGSMTTRFGDGTRADKAVQAIIDFTRFRKGDAFGLSLFGNEVLHWVPLTRDLSAIRLSAPFLQPNRMPRYMGGTQIAKALREVRKVLVDRPDGDRMVILISDGESADLLGGAAEEIANTLAADRITVFYIHVAEGQPQPEAAMIASRTGGAAFAAGDPQALATVFRSIDQMRPAKVQPAAPLSVDHFRPFALAGLALVGLQVVSFLGLRYTPW